MIIIYLITEGKGKKERKKITIKKETNIVYETIKLAVSPLAAMEIINSNKGGAKICYNGYMYTKQVTRKTKIWWRCVKRSSGQCRGSLTTDLNLENPEVTQLHNHASDESQIHLAKLRSWMRRQTTESLQTKSENFEHDMLQFNYPTVSISPPLVIKSEERTEFESGSPGERERLFVIDTDPGLDDAQAILMPLALDSINVLALTTVQGNSPSHCSTLNALRLLKVADRLDIPVYPGCERPLISKPLTAASYHGEDGFGDVPDVDAPGLDLAQSEHAVISLIRLVQEHPGEITLVALGPLTNIAMAIRLEPSFGTKLKDCYIMGGNYRGIGNITRSAEFNFANDPEAAQIVLTELKCPITLITWELCTDMQQPVSFLQMLNSLSGKKAEFMHTIQSRVKNLAEMTGYIMCDELAMAAAIDERTILGSQDVFAEVETQGLITKGQLIPDWRNRTNQLPNVRIVTQMDMDRVKELLINCFNQ